MWKFTPILKPTIWGGDKIIEFKGMKSQLSNIGESWELSGVEDAESVVEGGPDNGLLLSQLLDKYGADLLGKRNYLKFGNRFPLLVKLIDAEQHLSVQVHPDDELAKRKGHPNGKNEAWYALSDTKGGIAIGFVRKVLPDELERLIETDEIDNVLNYTDIHKGDVFYIPAGCVHSLRAGSLVIEVQQTSDVTYRLYDYHRKDAKGNERELHLDLAKDAIDYDDYDREKIDYALRMNVPTTVLNTPEFGINVFMCESDFMRDYSESDTFVVMICTEGEASVTCGDVTIELKGGNTVLIPAQCNGVRINPKVKTTLLEAYIK